MDIRPTSGTNAARTVRVRGGLYAGWDLGGLDGRFLNRPFGGGLQDWQDVTSSQASGRFSIDQQRMLDPVTRSPPE